VRAGRVTLVAALALGALALSAPAAGGSPTLVSGTYGVTDFGTLSCVPLGAAGFIVRCSTSGFVSSYSGSLTGTTTTTFTQLINCRTGRTQGSGVETFTGSIAGVGSGTLTWRDEFSAGFDCTTFAVSDFSGIGVALSGTGDLAGLHGTLSFTETTYDGALT
jgi:hypothetical protein